MPLVTVPWRPNGLPIAIAGWPGSICLESASCSGLTPPSTLDGSIFRTAMSVDGSVPTTSASIGSPFSVKRTETLRGALDDVVVGHDRAVGGVDPARAGALALGGGGGDVDDAGGDAAVDVGDVRGTAADVEDVAAGVAVAVADSGAGVRAVEGAARDEHGGDDGDRERAHHQVEEVGGAW